MKIKVIAVSSSSYVRDDLSHRELSSRLGSRDPWKEKLQGRAGGRAWTLELGRFLLRMSRQSLITSPRAQLGESKQEQIEEEPGRSHPESGVNARNPVTEDMNRHSRDWYADLQKSPLGLVDTNTTGRSQGH